MTQTTDKPAQVECQCGTVFGERCLWSGPIDGTVLVDWVPRDVRNGPWQAERLRVERTCGLRIIAQEAEWSEPVDWTADDTELEPYRHETEELEP